MCTIDVSTARTRASVPASAVATPLATDAALNELGFSSCS
jgi:hypothetical protein